MRLTPGEQHLSRVDPVMDELIRLHGPCRLPQRRRRKAPFVALVKSIVSQMLSGKAADTIYGRLCDLAGEPTPSAMLGLGEARLRSVGLSTTKAQAILELGKRASDGGLDLADLCRSDDGVISSQLLAVRGVGPWTVNMFLMFQLARKDVFPAGDLGVREGLKRAYGLEARPTQREAKRHAEAWAPYRSVAAWYLWRALEA